MSQQRDTGMLMTEPEVSMQERQMRPWQQDAMPAGQQHGAGMLTANLAPQKAMQMHRLG